MLLKGYEDVESINERNLTQELEIAKFRNYGRENFADLIKNKISLKEYFVHSSKFYSIKLPKEISENFIRIDISAYFWLSEAPLLKKIEILLVRNSSHHNYVQNYREIRNYYNKWLTQKTEKDKHFFILSIKNLIERNFAVQSFYNLILYGVILTNDTMSYNPKRAVELFDRAIELVNSSKFSLSDKNELLYLIKVYKGFAFIKEYEFLKSSHSFSEALKHNSNGVTALFYSALSSRYLDEFDIAYDYLRKVLEYDRARFQFAIDFNHLGLFTFFYKEAVFYNVFTEVGFSQLLPDIDFLIKSLFSDETNSMELTYSKLINLDNLFIKQFYDNSVYNEIKFLKEALDQYKQKQHGLIRIVEQIFRNKLFTLIEYIRNLIESHYFDQIKDEILVFDKQIEQNKKHLERIKLEKEDAKKKIKMNMDEAADDLEESLSERSKQIELKIENLDENPKYNPTNVFFSSIIFTITISIVIILVIGVITSIVGFGDNSASFANGVKEGLIWGGMAFIIGTFISIFTSLSSFWEKASEKKVLLSRLNSVKESDSEEREILNEDSERTTTTYQKKFEDRLLAQEKIISEFIAEREHNYDKQYSIAKKEIDIYINPLNKLHKSFEDHG